MRSLSRSLCLATLTSVAVATPSLRAFDKAPRTPRFALNVVANALDSIADLNNDGRRDLIIGIPSQNRVVVVSGQTGTTLLLINGPAGSEFGFDVASTSDINVDTLDEILVGAPGLGGVGGAFLYSGRTGALLRAWGPSTASFAPMRYGHSVSRAGGDMGGNFQEDVIIGAPNNDLLGAFPLTGAVEVVDVNPAAPAVLSTFFGTAAGDQFGWSVLGVPHIDTDTLADMVVGSPQTTTPLALGQISIFTQIGTATPPPPTILGGTTVSGSAFGTSLAYLGDPSIGSFDNLAVGEPFPGIPTGVVQRISVMPISQFFLNPPGCQDHGQAVSGLGDYNGNGFRDVLVGSPADPVVCTAPGTAFILDGDPALGLPKLVNLQATGMTASFGFDVTEIDHSTSPLTWAVADPMASQVFVY